VPECDRFRRRSTIAFKSSVSSRRSEGEVVQHEDDFLLVFAKLADKAYDTDAFRAWLPKREVEAVIPSTLRRKRPCSWDQEAYCRRNLIERMFCRMKDWRRMATRYDRLARNYLSALALVAVVCFWSN
jgi:transposase